MGDKPSKDNFWENQNAARQTYICKLCGEDVEKVEEHHPIPEKIGGKETILYCLICHRHDEALIKKLIGEIETGTIQLDYEGKDPYTDRRAALRTALEEFHKKQEELGEQEILF